MKQILQAWLVVVSVAWTSLAHALPDIHQWSTEKGAKVLFVHAPELPMVDIRLVFDAGSARDGDQLGLARFANGLLDQGADGLDAGEIARGFEMRGASISNGSERDMAWLSLRSLTDEKLLAPVLKLFEKVVANPNFPEQDFQRERKRVLVSLQFQKQQPKTIASKRFYKEIYGDHPYASDPTGTVASVEALTIGDLRKFYDRYYVARNAIVVIVGDVSREKAHSIATQLADALPIGKAALLLPEVPELKEAEQVFIEHPSSQSHVLMGAPGIKRKDPDYFSLYVGNHILGGSGLVSRISEEIRDKRGLSYSAYSYFVPMRKKGPYTLGFQTKNDQRDESLDVLKQTLADFIEKGPREDELLASKSNIVGGFPLRVASNGKIVGYLAVIGFYDLPLDYLSQFTRQVEAVTVDSIHDAYRRRVIPSRMATVIVGGPL